MKKLAVGTAILAAAAIAFAGGDVWKTKSMDQWTDKDINEILMTSPWAKAGVLPQGAATRPDGMTPASGSSGIAGSKSDTAHVAAGSDPQQTGASEKQDSAAANQATYSIYWWSSRTIRAASERRAVLKGTVTEAEAEKTVSNEPPEYMILVQGTNMQIFQHRGEQAFEKAAYLQLKKTKEKVYPTKVGFLKTADGGVNGAIFYFPKKSASGEPTIAPEEKEIDFYLQMGGAKLYTYFDPRKMVDSKGEDL